MSKSTKEILRDAKMLTRVMQQTLNKNSIPYNENEDLRDYLTLLLKKEKENQKKAVVFSNQRAIKQNLESQISAMKRYEIQ
ncbi:hypothetical protein [Cytobacillus pseudoceanisediminis]|uniref:hypothetical protein n=1 Tax=Cytobacillus pseudoceanisediminis TaxID=3051614 RepID=UPI003C2C6A4B